MNRTNEIITRLRRIAGNTSCMNTSLEQTVIANQLEYQNKKENEK